MMYKIENKRRKYTDADAGMPVLATVPDKH